MLPAINLELLQVSLNLGSKKQDRWSGVDELPIPNGYGISISPQVDLQPGRACFGVVAESVWWGATATTTRANATISTRRSCKCFITNSIGRGRSQIRKLLNTHKGFVPFAMHINLSWRAVCYMLLCCDDSKYIYVTIVTNHILNQLLYCYFIKIPTKVWGRLTRYISSYRRTSTQTFEYWSQSLLYVVALAKAGIQPWRRCTNCII